MGQSGPDLLPSVIHAIPGTIQENFPQNRILMTGLNGAFLITIFPYLWFNRRAERQTILKSR